MSEHIISYEVLQGIQRTCYEAGKAGREAYTVRGADGPEIIRCRDCKHHYSHLYKTSEMSDAIEHRCELHRTPYGEPEDVLPDGFCAWAERREA